ncbi:hypothetical protein OHA37_09170 [Streptomyces sp. NBC_00335]|uniref:hypothetical protein n=1 Tax=unclassified Streptomyces TaxID=2593676 RepID=UPI002255A2D3|nr:MULTISPECIES: hypothetical protein [unclassified Streptomyces]MCX5404054.1 hypothetical protein [Streptomyces sp. NBC_00086]
MRTSSILTGGALALATGFGLAGPAAAAGSPAAAAASNPVVLQPNPVAPGGQFSVFDGGNCKGKEGLATFKTGVTGSSIPTVKLSMLKNEVGGVGTVPASTKPGSYEVSVVCDDGKGNVEGPFTGTLTVSAAHPKGAVKTGLGGTQDSGTNLAAGIGALGAAAVGGVWMARRRTASGRA